MWIAGVFVERESICRYRLKVLISFWMGAVLMGVEFRVAGMPSSEGE